MCWQACGRPQSHHPRDGALKERAVGSGGTQQGALAPFTPGEPGPVAGRGLQCPLGASSSRAWLGPGCGQALGLQPQASRVPG